MAAVVSAKALPAMRYLSRSVTRPARGGWNAAYSQQRGVCARSMILKSSQLARGLSSRLAVALARPHEIQQREWRRQMVTVAEQSRTAYPTEGPIPEYDARVQSGRLRDDAHQRGLIYSLQDLHDTLARYKPDEVVKPTIESLKPKPTSFFGSLLGRKGDGQMKMRPRENLPKGLYMYGDVGSGKTMLMDLFYDTLPLNIIYKTRIHFHNFMQDVHKQLHKMKMQHGSSIDCIPFVAAEIAEKASVLCFDEFQCTDVADAMILRRLIESLMAHGTVLVTTSNRHPTELYKNGVQRESFVPCINLLTDQLHVLNLDSTTDYRKIPRPPSGVYHHPIDAGAERHAEHWFKFLGDIENDPPHRETQHVWGREIEVPRASGKACWFTFDQLIGSATGAADYLELAQHYQAFIITGVPGMNYRSRDLARRFITFLDAIYESRAKLVLTTEVPLTQLFMSKAEVDEMVDKAAGTGGLNSKKTKAVKDGDGVDDAMRSLMDDLGLNMETLKKSNMFTGDEEAFAFARALSRLTEMGSQEWVERGLGMGAAGKQDTEDWKKVRGSWRQDSY